jgi:membrane protein
MTIMKRQINNIKKSLPISLITKTYKNWRNDRTLRLGAGIAYYGVFAIIPMFTLMLGVAAYFYSTQDVKNFVSDVLVRIFGGELFSAINQIVDRAFSSETQDILTGASIIGVISLIVAASFIFVAFQDALDFIWKNDVRLGIKAWLKRYIWAYLVVMVASLLLFLVFLVNSIGSVLSSIFPGQFVVIEFLENVAVTVSSWVVGILILAFIYRLLIYKKVQWRILIFGSAVTSILIFVGTWALGLYIRNYSGSSVSGALGGVLLLLIWVYYESQIALIGAQFIKTLDENKDKLPNIIAK